MWVMWNKHTAREMRRDAVRVLTYLPDCGIFPWQGIRDSISS